MSPVSRVPSIAPSPEPRLFTATLQAHRSLSARGFALLMTVIGGISFGLGIAFASMGAWPVLGIFGLDAALIWWAFRRNYRDARAFEEIDLTVSRLLVRQVSAEGEETEHRFNPYWTRLEIERGSWGIVGVAVTGGGRRLAIGRFLSAPDRASLAAALSRALATARAAPSVG